MEMYWIGGSPCSGKSTVALALAQRFGLQYFKVDDHLGRYMDMAAADGKPACTGVAKLSPEQIWMRPPLEQCEEELAIYEEISDYILADLEKLDRTHGIITEGAAYLPLLARRCALPFHRYISITPTKAFQVSHYRRRAWVPGILAGCSDPRKAFDNWMDRDALFAIAVQKQCEELGYASLINRGDRSVDEYLTAVAAHFGLL